MSGLNNAAQQQAVLPGGAVPSFLELTFDPQVLTAACVAQQQSKQRQQAAAAAAAASSVQLPPLPPHSRAAAQMQAATALHQQVQRQAPSAVPHDATAATMAIDHEPMQQLQQQQLLQMQQQHDQQAAAAALASAAAAAAAATVTTAVEQQYDEYGQYNAEQYAALAAGYAGGYSAGSAAFSYPGGYAAAAAAGYAADNGGSSSYYNGAAGGSRGGGRSSRGRGRGSHRSTSSDPGSDYEEDMLAGQQQQHIQRQQQYQEQYYQQQQSMNKRHKKDGGEAAQAPLDAESQLLLIGFLSAVVEDAVMLEQCQISAAGFDQQREQQQQQQQTAGSDGPELKRMSVLKTYQLAQSLARNVKDSGALSQLWGLRLNFSEARNMLALGGVLGVDDVVLSCAEEARAALSGGEATALQLSKAKADGLVDTLADMLQHTMEQLLTEAGHMPDKLLLSKPLPRCILENKEPFAHKEWRKEPYEPRPYVELTDYAITSNVPAEVKLLRWRLTTRRRDGAGDGFREKHLDMTPQQLAAKEQHLVQQVLNRQALKKGVDVVEVDSWGMDCYTRRNVFDAVLQANVFKHRRGAPQQQQQQQTGKQQHGRRQQQRSSDRTQHARRSPQQEQELERQQQDRQEQQIVQQQEASGPQQRCKQAELQQQQQQQDSKTPSPQQQQQQADKQQQSDHQPEPDQRQQRSSNSGAGSARQSPDVDMAEVEDSSAAGFEGTTRSKREGKRVSYADDAQAGATQVKAASRDKQSAHSKAEEDAVHDWIDSVFMPAVNQAGQDGWDILRVVHSIKDKALQKGDQVSVAAAEAVLNQFNNSGYPWFRLHPKGRGMVVSRPQGVAAFTLVEEYFGELHTGWRWFEIQDAIKKITQKDLPDFYNILLERPRDDPDGYDLTFVDAAFMGSFASRMSHSCTPNCQAVVVSCGGKLTVVLYTIRDIAPGEELTFDYSSVTESEDEFKQAFCMCSTRHCRGSYLYYTGSKAYMQVIESHHTFLDRQVLLLRCCMEPLNQADLMRLDRAGLRGSALGRTDVDCNPEVPGWLKKWAALTLEFVEQERQLLPGELQSLPPPLTQSEADSIAAAVGVELNRVQNIVISLDKAKYCLNQPGQTREPPLLLLSDTEVAEYLWNGERSVAKRAVRAAAAAVLTAQEAHIVGAANTAYDFEQLGQHFQESQPLVAALLLQLAHTVEGAADARRALQQLILQLRELDVNANGGHTRAADVLQLYAATQMWFASNRNYISFTSPPLQLHEDMISMHGGLDTSQHHKGSSSSSVRRSSSGTALGNAAGRSVPAATAVYDAESGAATVVPSSADAGVSSDDYDPEYDSEDEGGPGRGGRGARGCGRGRGRGRGRWSGRGGPALKPLKGISSKILEKRYAPHYIWAQLSSWYKQTVYDPSASLSADRRGTLTLPDIEGCYASKEGYDIRERHRLIRHVAEQPERQWTSSAWSFRNDAKIYGSPMFDALWGEVMDGVDRYTALEDLAHTLLTAPLPVCLGGDGTMGGKGKQGTSSGRRGGRGRGGAGRGRGGRIAGGGSSGVAYSSVGGSDAHTGGADEGDEAQVQAGSEADGMEVGDPAAAAGVTDAAAAAAMDADVSRVSHGGAAATGIAGAAAAAAPAAAAKFYATVSAAAGSVQVAAATEFGGPS